MDELPRHDEMRDRIFTLMKELGISQKELAEKIHVSSQTITDWKKGKSTSFTSKLPELSIALQTTPTWIWFGQGYKHLSAEERANMARQEQIDVERYLWEISGMSEQEVQQELRSAFRTMEQRKSRTFRTEGGMAELADMYRSLNEEGREKLLDYADDLLSSGKYIKTGEDQLDKEKDA